MHVIAIVIPIFNWAGIVFESQQYGVLILHQAYNASACYWLGMMGVLIAQPAQVAAGRRDHPGSRARASLGRQTQWHVVLFRFF